MNGQRPDEEIHGVKAQTEDCLSLRSLRPERQHAGASQSIHLEAPQTLSFWVCMEARAWWTPSVAVGDWTRPPAHLPSMEVRVGVGSSNPLIMADSPGNQSVTWVLPKSHVRAIARAPVWLSTQDIPRILGAIVPGTQTKAKYMLPIKWQHHTISQLHIWQIDGFDEGE